MLLAFNNVSIDTVEICIQCGVRFAFDEVLRKRRVEDHQNFYCPNGHQQHYVGETEAQKLKKQLEQKEKQLASANEWKDYYLKDRDAIKRKATALKGVVTRTKNRISNGICPCCNRSFENLHRHMKTKHPEYKDE